MARGGRAAGITDIYIFIFGSDDAMTEEFYDGKVILI